MDKFEACGVHDGSHQQSRLSSKFGSERRVGQIWTDLPLSFELAAIRCRPF